MKTKLLLGAVTKTRPALFPASIKSIVTNLRARADRSTRLALQCDPKMTPIEEAFWAAGYVELSRLGRFTPQAPVPPYRVDFALEGRCFRIAIECDGYEFHSSEIQISADNSRDLELGCQGWMVVRFTGGRIWRDVQGCVADVARMARAVR